MRLNINNIINAQRRMRCKNITPEVSISPRVGSKEYFEWKKKADAEWKEYKKEEEKKQLTEKKKD
jgi:hypothetical protein